MSQPDCKIPAAPVQPPRVLALSGIDLGASAPTVERGPDGLPTAFRVLKTGRNAWLYGGMKLEADYDAAALAHLVALQAERGSELPVDLDHGLLALGRELEAGTLAASELRAAQKIAGHPAVGWLRLEQRPDGVWARVQSWTARGAELLRSRAYRYISPVLHGWATDEPRISSVSLVNTPATVGLEPLVASGETSYSLSPSGVESRGATKTGGAAASDKRGGGMQPILTVIAALLGLDALALSAEGDAPEGVVEKLKAIQAELAELRKLRSQAAEVLALGGEPSQASADAILGGIRAAQAVKGKTADLEAKVLELAAEAESRKRSDLIDAGLAKGKLSQAQADGWAAKASLGELESYLAATPEGGVVALSGIGEISRKPEVSGNAKPGLGPELDRVAKACGLDPAKVRERAAARA